MIKKGKIITSLVLSLALVSQSSYLISAQTISNENNELLTVDGKKKTEKDLYNAIDFNAGYTPALEAIDFKVMEEKYKDDSRLKGIIDKKYDEAVEAAKETDKGLKNSYKLFNATSKSDYIKKSNILLESYRELAAMDTAYDELFTKEQKDYIYKYRFSGTAKIYHLLVSPKITYTDSTDETKLNKAQSEALKTAEQAIADLKGGAKFKEVVAKYSDDKLNEDGYIGEFDIDSATKANVDQTIRTAAFQLKDKEYSVKPIETKYGYEIVYVEYTKEKKPYDEVKDQVKSKLYDMYIQANTYTSAYALDLYRSNKKISFDENTYSKTYANAVIQSKKSYVQYDPNEQNQYGDYMGGQ